MTNVIGVGYVYGTCLCALIVLYYSSIFRYSMEAANVRTTAQPVHRWMEISGLQAARHLHPACACDRNFSRAKIGMASDPECGHPTTRDHILSTEQILRILENRTVALIGDSVVRQEECNLRCLLRDFYIHQQARRYGSVKVVMYHFKHNISLVYCKAGAPWNDPVTPRYGIERLLADVDVMYWNIGNHYREAGVLRSALQAHADVYRSLPLGQRPVQLFRLQSPPHFKTIDGHLESVALTPPLDKSICENNGTLIDGRRSFRYTVGLSFAIENRLSYMDVSNIANKGCFHPDHGDCLHYDQDSWILSAINSMMLRKLESLEAL